MPDWSYHPLKKLLLDRLSPKTSREFIHKCISTIASISGGRSLIRFLGNMNPPQECQKYLEQTSFPSPIGLSSIIDPSLSGTNAFQELGLGFLEIGPIVLDKPRKQMEPVLENEHILLSNNFEKVPLKLAIKKLTSLDICIPIFARIDAQVKRNEWDLIVQHLTPFVDFFIVTKEQMNSFLQKDISCSRSFFISLTVDEMHEDTLEIEKFHKQINVGGIVVTAPCRMKDSYWHEDADANKSLRRAVKHVKERYPDIVVITSGGVETPEDACSLMDSGADFIMLTNGYVKAGPGLTKRIHERLLFTENQPVLKQQWIWSFLFGLSILFGGLIALYFAFTSIILSYDESFIGLTKAKLVQINPLILSFMSHDRMALAGTMISAGILYIQLARHGIKDGMKWAKITFHSAAIIGFLGIFLFIGFGYFDWLHGLFWLVLLPIYYFSFKEGTKVTGTPSSSHEKNDRTWMLGLYGQLMFIILGFSIIIGGIVISTIGISNVFVSTDLRFLCMSPQMLDRVSDHLIPVIAHDRAGFGSSLISVGSLVLMLSLWGFRKGERWIWNTLTLGALPAFIAGIGTHFYIGYTTPIHLFPVYFLVLLYMLGIVFSYPFLKTKN
ncbi:dihydroorotate dehydrogenase [Heyndrickxia camelliae]|uniref:Dihydroorotate dehydrogenase n=1 Tax=Heyndrickxia camelliae TaxID=1707093 RepID=A0A2N3LM66_9BACI|nr:dihydroorotate dehydrogenase [Heyndrickxia camelliae]PKR85655.1 dihydroorotate dehydrogenase [Heyndrickxia camelliae]